MTERFNELGPGPGDVSRLKTLLFSNEQQAIDDIKDQLAAHHDRIGSDVEMRKSVADILAGALHDARVERHREVSDAIAPILVEGMKREIRNSRDEMVDALYPIMGRLVSAYVSSAVAEMMEQTNQRLESGLSGRFLYLRAKSKLTGVPYAELVMTQTRRFQINELMLIRRGSGLLLDHINLDVENGGAANAMESRAAGGKDMDRNSALISGVVAAIHEFAQDAFSNRKNSLRSVDMGDQTIYLRATSGLIFAVIGRGNATRKFEKAVDAELLNLLEERSDEIAQLEDPDASVTPKILPMVAHRLVTVQREKSKKKPVLAIFLVGLIGAAIAGYAGWTGFEAVRMAQLRASIAATIDRQPEFAGYPVQVDISPDRAHVRISGFAPSREARDRLVAGLDGKVQGAVLTPKFVVMDADNGLEERVAGLDTQTRALGTQAAQQATALRERADALEVTTGQRSAALRERIDAIERVFNDPMNQLRIWTGRHAIFFGDGVTYRERTKARKSLADLAALIGKANARIRVVGYADARGTPKSNEKLAKERADQVLVDLARAGVERSKIVAVGRSAERQLSTLLGPESGNRRVEFEVMLAGE